MEAVTTGSHIEQVDAGHGNDSKKMSSTKITAVPQAKQKVNQASPARENLAVGTDQDSELASTEPSLTSSLANLNIQGAEIGHPEILPFASKLDDERTHISVSSLQAHSISSGLAFAMDEKESIRPDDSASVQAVEDDESNSGPGSGAQNSRFGSETGGKPFQSQLQEISVQKGPPFVAKIEEQTDMLAAPQFSYWVPDQKLLEALETPKDRLFLLQLEQQIIAFSQNSTQESLDLPPSNSFLRLLAHRLADYYRLSHYVDSATNTLRVYKTSTTPLPPPLSAFRPTVTLEAVPQSGPSLKIMRRLDTNGQLAEVIATANSMIGLSSKMTSDSSEHGSELVSPAESSTAKDKSSQTREQREAKYKEARDRIFANWKEENEGEPSSNASADASRASSVTGRKKKKKTQDDDFEARSAFYRQQPFDPSTGQGGYFVPYMVPAGTSMVQPSYGPVFQPQYHIMQQPQMVPNGMIPQANGQVMYQQPMPQQYVNYGMPQQIMAPPYYQPVMQPQPQVLQPPAQMQFGQQHFIQTPCPPASTQVSRPGSQMSEQSWNQPMVQAQYYAFPQQAQYPSQIPQPTASPSSNGVSVPYAYGQLPFQAQAPDDRNVHPLPGSYSRQSYKAQARGAPGPMPQLGNAQAVQYSYPPQTMLQPQPQPQPQSLPQPVQYPSTTYSSSGSDHSRKQNIHSIPIPPASTISKWGTPSTLPPKPPPPATRLHDTSMPTFHNGTYTKPSNPPQDARAV